MKNRNQKGMSDVGFMFLSMVGSFGFLTLLMMGGLHVALKSASFLAF
ncbi:MAG TPA: hypothetical protein V6C76_10690 [Drouetiella sp.]